MAALKLRHKILIALLPNLLLFGMAEAACRWIYYKRTGVFGYLITPFRIGGEEPAKKLAYPEAGSASSFTYHDDCGNRTVSWTINDLGVRGGKWELEKKPGTLRVITIGGSTTLGMKNPDWATYPLFLEQALARENAAPHVEVLNGGWIGMRLADITHHYKNKLAKFRPDLVIFYEGWNDTPKAYLSQDVDYDILRAHRDSWLGRMASRLYYRSLLYTYLIEKFQFANARQYRKQITPRIALYKSEMERLISEIRQSGAEPVFVLQLNNSQRVTGLSELDLNDFWAVRRFIVQAAHRDRRAEFEHKYRFRFYQSQVVDELIRRLGDEHQIQVIDPWPTFAVYPPGEELFCGPIHLTDLGNQLLGETVSELLYLPSPFKTARSSGNEN